VFLLVVQLAASWLCPNPVYAADINARSGASAVPVQAGADPVPAHASLKVITFNIRWQEDDHGKFIDSGFARRKLLVLIPAHWKITPNHQAMSDIRISIVDP
jgi:hypothetical protein